MKKYILSFLLVFTVALNAEFKVGEKLPPITLPDQFEKNLKVEKTDTLLMISFEKEVSAKIKEYLETKPKGFLNKHHTKYISDISGMPSFVTSWFAIPKMKKYPFSIMLIHDEFGKNFSKQEGKITVYKIKDHNVVAIEHISPDKLATLF